MNVEVWQANNSRYLATAVEWLRLRLLRLAADTQRVATVESMPVEITSPSIVDRLFGRPTSTAPLNAPALPPPSDSTDEQIRRAAQALHELEATDPPPALIMLGQQLGLARFESEVLLLCAALEMDTRLAAWCARVQDDAQRPYPTFALALSLFDEPAWEALSPDRPLRYWRLIEINQPAAQPLTTSALRADERIVNYLKGLNQLDDRLTTFLSPIELSYTAEIDLPPSQQAAADDIVLHWRRSLESATLPMAQLLGADVVAKQAVAAQAAATLGRLLYRLPAESLPASSGDLQTLARLWQRESRLLPLALYVDAQEIDSANLDSHAPLTGFLARTDGVIFLGVRDRWPRLPHAHFDIDVAKPTTAEQQASWLAILGPQAIDLAGQLAAQFNLNQAAIAAIAHDVLLDAARDDPQLKLKLWATCCTVTRPRLDALAQRLDPKATWEDLVLPAEQITLLHQIADQVGQRHKVYEEWGYAAKMNRGLGISALFAGDSGTGKTMAAEVIANELRLNLYRIDLSAVVSKYIGETEKNLRRLFDAAEDGGAILFFDEADALFGKRSEVKDSHDRYANIEINYLLQRMEAYRGLAILATNLKSALDQAFMRRLRFSVNFPFPSAAERKVIWQKVFPPQVPKAELDYERLARFNITGGNIHSIALNAAFSAAQTGVPVNTAGVLAAVRTEFRKLEKPINEADFRV
ncbi:ATP-dependent zinc metalloprotease FtsH [Thermoflexales bacterium]|nr:ATP-dependent zinc metalloprotease FtsH [Thermoflexales bacterium]